MDTLPHDSPAAVTAAGGLRLPEGVQRFRRVGSCCMSSPERMERMPAVVPELNRSDDKS